MKVYMIRHGATKGNKEHRYVGSTDEGLLPEERKRLAGQKMPKVGHIYVSPFRRCRETADLLYPDIPKTMVGEFRECDFGRFEYCNYQELNGDPDYQRFINTMGRSGFPGGEDRDTFQKRCVDAMDAVIKMAGQQDIALVVHGGTIMALLDWYANPHKDYYEWQVGNGCGWETELVWSLDKERFYLEQIEKWTE